MKSHARVVVIGGGISGCALLYNLARKGWTDVVLVEKAELTSGSTWHASAQLTQAEDSPLVCRINLLSGKNYRALQNDTGRSIGLHESGCIHIVRTPEAMAKYIRRGAKVRALGIDFEMIGANQIKDLFPLVNLEGVLGGAYMPGEGHIDPSMATHAFAHGARERGAEIYRHTRVEALTSRPNGEWEVRTDKGVIVAENVVNCAGFWAPEIAAMVGKTLPIVPMERQYFVTEAIPEIEAMDRELPIFRDMSVPYYMRQEGKGLLFGVHERGVPFCFVDGIPREFSQQLLPPDLDRGADHIAAGMERVPALGKVGIKTVVCGPTSRTPDLNGLMGPLGGLNNFYVMAGFSAALSKGGALGQLMAEWMVDGEPSLDMWEFDVNRFGPYATKRYVRSMLLEAHSYGTLDPNAERRGGRPAKTSPIYHRLKEQGAQYGARFGWERPLWFAADDVAEKATQGSAQWCSYLEAECRAVREGVGIVDLASVAKYQVSGAHAGEYLDRLCANSIPTEDGAAVVSQMLTSSGGIRCNMTVARLSADRYYLTARTEAELHHLDWLERHLPAEGGVRVENLTARHGALAVIGPRSRDVLAAVTDIDLANGIFPWMTAKEMTVGFAPVVALKTNDAGELGWELYFPIEYQAGLYDALMGASPDLAVTNVGIDALDSLRLEKGNPVWPTDLSLAHSPFEAGLDRFVALDKGDFIGRDALVDQRRKGLSRRLVSIAVEVKDAAPQRGEPVYRYDNVVGLVTSGGYGHAVRSSIALAYLPLELSAAGTGLEVEVRAERRPATVTDTPMYDPENMRVSA